MFPYDTMMEAVSKSLGLLSITVFSDAYLFQVATLSIVPLQICVGRVKCLPKLLKVSMNKGGRDKLPVGKMKVKNMYH